MKINVPYHPGADHTGGMEGPNLSLLDHCLSQVGPNDEVYGDTIAVEFGVGSGKTTRMITRVVPVIGFDSFKGLPETWRPDFPVGRFNEYDMPFDIHGATIVPGWFEDTVTGYDWPDNIGLIHFDADLYSSTVTCLASIGPFIKEGCILLFDEFHGFTDDVAGSIPGEQRALHEYAAEHGWILESIGYGREQMAFRFLGEMDKVGTGATPGFIVGPEGFWISLSDGVVNLADLYDEAAVIGGNAFTEVNA